jgi:hypothetical protein
LFFSLFAIIGLSPGTLQNENIIGLLIVAFWFADLVAISLGIAGIFDRASKKLFAILGLSFGLGTLLITVGTIAIGFFTMKQ